MEEKSVRAFLRDSLNIKNGASFILMIITCSFSYYLINFYVKYLPGDIFTNQIVNSLAEGVAHAASAVVVLIMSTRKGFAAGYGVCAISCVIVMYSQFYDSSWLIPIGVLGAKAGISVAFCFLYFSQVNYFTSAFLGLIMGSSNVVGRCSTILAPVVAELPDPTAMVSCLLLCIMGLFCCLLLEQPKSIKKEDLDKSELQLSHR